MPDITSYIDVEQLATYQKSQRKQPVNSRKVVLDNIEFDSGAEAGRWQELKLLQRAGVIQQLTTHPEFVIQEKGKDAFGQAFRKRTYTADFQYWDVDKGRWIVEDVKGPKRTKTGRIVPHVERDFRLRWDRARTLNPDLEFVIVIR
jgi:hypothetical protein